MPYVVIASIYYFAVNFFLPEILQLPHKLATPRINSSRIFGRRVSKYSGAAIILLLSIAGFSIWFGLMLAPVYIFNMQLYAVAPPQYWGFIPMVAGMVVRRLLRK